MQELDRFWDIDALLPSRRIPARSTGTDAEEVTVAAQADRTPVTHSEALPPRPDTTVIHPHEAPLGGAPVRRAVFPPSPPEPSPLEDYEPDSALLHRVEIFPLSPGKTYFAEFRRTALALSGRHGDPDAKPVPFFSYVPQYDQMTAAQLNWYLCLRDSIRQGLYPKTDCSYLLLLAYEIINLAQDYDTGCGQAILVCIWQNYRAEHPKLDRYLPEWICDYSLIHRLPPPELPHMERMEIMQHCQLKEFYVSGGADGYLRALLAFASNYDYRKSKFCTPETLPLFDRVIPAVLTAVMERLSPDGKLFALAHMDDSLKLRIAYEGALCASECSRKLNVSYCSFSRSHELRFLITDLVKYTENKLRARLGVRSRMSVYALPGEVREMIDAVCDPLLPKKDPAAHQKKTEPPAYEKLYDLPSLPLDPDRAAEIERTSWDTTERLVEAFNEQDDIPDAVETPAPASPIPPAPPEKGQTSPYARYRRFLTAVRNADNAGIRAAAQALGTLPDALADEVNELATEDFGDILLEDGGDGWRVLDDYRDLLNTILSDTKKGD